MILVLFVILTGDFPTIIQALAFGVEGDAGIEFAAAMVSTLVRDVLLLAPLFMYARHPLGILHPLILAVLVWPILISTPGLVQQLGGWAPLFLGGPVAIPFFEGLGWRSAAGIWTSIAKFNVLESAAIGSTYLGYVLWRGGAGRSRAPTELNPQGVRTVALALIFLSTLGLLAFLYNRGGLSEHLTDLGRGRFRSLKGMGIAVVMTDLSTIAAMLWIAARPNDAKSPFFIGAALLVAASQFLSNGSRGAALLSLLLIAMVWAARQRRVPWRLGLILAPILVLTLGGLAAIRTASWTGQTAGEAASGLSIGSAFERMQEEMQLRRALSAQIPVVDQGFEKTNGALLGRSYLAAVFAFVPRAIWEDKPRGPGSLYAQLFLHYGREDVAIPVGATAESYWNFGALGSLLLFTLYGILLRVVYLYYLRRFPNPFAVCLYTLFVSTFHVSTDELVAFQQQLALLLFAYMSIRFFVSPTRRRRRISLDAGRTAGIGHRPATGVFHPARS